MQRIVPLTKKQATMPNLDCGRFAHILKQQRKHCMSAEGTHRKTKTASESRIARVSPTAFGVAYFRTFTDIPFSLEFFNELRGGRGLEEINNIAEATGGRESTPMFEARYKMINQLLQEQGTNQILEIAAGFSPRGLIMSQNPQTKYVELDLPSVINDKEEFARKLESQGKINLGKNLRLVKGNALDEKDILSAIESFDLQPVTVLHEGLLRYLSRAEQRVLAQNIKRVLEIYGGIWITPDVIIRETGSTSNTQEQIQKNAVLVGINTEANLFENWEEAESFFTEQGFQIETHDFNELREPLLSPGKLGLSQEDVRNALRRKVFIMKL